MQELMEDRVVAHRAVLGEGTALLAFGFDLAVLRYQRCYAAALWRGEYSEEVSEAERMIDRMWRARYPYSEVDAPRQVQQLLLKLRREAARDVLVRQLEVVQIEEEERLARMG